MPSSNSFETRSALTVAGREVQVYSLTRLEAAGFPEIARLPYSLKILLENLLRHEDERFVKAKDIESLARWDVKGALQKEVSFVPARVLLQDFTGVPAVVDLAAMRDAVARLGGDANRVNPLQPVELVIDHSVQVDYFGQVNAFELNAELEFSRNKERYAFLRWGQNAFHNFQVVPPDTGIVHQVNLEYLARVVMAVDGPNGTLAYPDTLVGTDSHTTMVNGLGVVGWGVGGIEAEAAMLGQPISMLIPRVLGVRLTGTMLEGATATDLVLTITERLRKHGVVGKFVEFFGSGLEHLTIADRATLGNMCPEYGATIAIFPIDEMTLDYLRLTGRDESRVQLVEAYAKAQGLFRRADAPDPVYSETIELDLGSVEPSLAGPKRPQDRVSLKQAKISFQTSLGSMMTAARKSAALPSSGGTMASEGAVAVADLPAVAQQLDHGSVVIAAITSCTNTSNPSVMIGAGSAREESRRARIDAEAMGEDEPGSRLEGRDGVSAGCRADAVSRAARVQSGRLRLHDVHRQQRSAPRRGRGGGRRAQSRGGRGAERQPQLRGAHPAAGARELPRLAPAGRRLRARRAHDARPHDRADRRRRDKASRCICGSSGRPSARSRKRCWPRCTPEMFREQYADVFAGDARWRSLGVPIGDRFAWEPDSTYIRNPPFFDGLDAPARAARGYRGRARARAARRQHHHRPHLAGRCRSRRTARRGST